MQNAAQAYGIVAKKTASPRELEATLLLKAASKLQAVRDAWNGKPPGLNDALLYNRRLWVVFIDSVTSGESPLPPDVRQNIANIGIFVMNETFSLMTNPRPDSLSSLININRELAAGLQGRG